MQNSLIKNNLRSVISLVDKLRDIKLEEYIKLPKIVAVGSQSSGKSSLIEQVVGLDILPRGSGVVTRRPLQIRMVYQQGLKQPYGCFDQIPGQKFTDFDKVKSSIEQLTDKICGKSKNIVDKAIVLYIYSANCPNLTIIDLPGLTRISIESQAANIHEVTQKMIRKYMEEENTIILCVIPANQDVTNDEVLHMARQIDVKGERTIGCITKIDIMDRGTDARALLLNKEVPLKLGYVGIKNRSQADINENKKVKESLEDEKMFFSKSPIYSSLPSQCLGTTSLVDKMTKVLESCIVNYMPTLLEKIRQKKAALAEKMKHYGKPLPQTIQQKQSLIWQICNDYILNYKNAIRNIPSAFSSSQRIQKVSMHVQQGLRDFLVEESKINLSEELKDTKISFALKKFDTINTLGFPSLNSFLYLLNPILNDLKSPMESSLSHLCYHINHMAELIAGEVAGEFKEFRQYIISRNVEIVNEFRRKAHIFLQQMLECEIKGVTYQKLDFDRKIDQKTLTQLERRNPLIPILRQSVIKYYERCVYNLRELVPKNFSYLLLTEATKKIEFEIFQSCAGSEEKIQKWLEMNSYSVQQRVKNQKEFDVIQKAEQHILTYNGFSKSMTLKKTKKREERQKEMQLAMEKEKEKKRKREEEKKLLQSSRFLKKQQPQSQTKTQVSQNTQKGPTKQTTINPKQEAHYHAKKEQKQPQKAPVPEQKQNVFAQLFGFGGSSQPKKEEKKEEKVDSFKQQPNQTSGRKPIFPSQGPQQNNPQKHLKQKYNQEMGKATDKAVDEMFKNEKFQQESKKAVEKGASLAFQKQFGVSQQTANSFGKGAGWLWSNDKVQNAAKDQAKKQARDQTQW